MKFLPSQLYYFLRHRPSRVSLLNLGRFLLLLAGLITLYSVLFHYIMALEGQQHSWVTGFYWTLTVMSTLGFGDITFQSDLGRVFSSIVLVSGVLFLLILLPFTFIEFFYAPWMRLQAEKRAPTSVPPHTAGHIILTSFDPVTQALVERLAQYHYDYVLLVSELAEALRLHDLGYRVVRGDLDDPQTYRLLAAERARLVASTANDMLNTNIAFTVREISETVPVMTTANFRAVSLHPILYQSLTAIVYHPFTGNMYHPFTANVYHPGQSGIRQLRFQRQSTTRWRNNGRKKETNRGHLCIATTYAERRQQPADQTGVGHRPANGAQVPGVGGSIRAAGRDIAAD